MGTRGRGTMAPETRAGRGARGGGSPGRRGSKRRAPEGEAAGGPGGPDAGAVEALAVERQCRYFRAELLKLLSSCHSGLAQREAPEWLLQRGNSEALALKYARDRGLLVSRSVGTQTLAVQGLAPLLRVGGEPTASETPPPPVNVPPAAEAGGRGGGTLGPEGFGHAIAEEGAWAGQARAAAAAAAERAQFYMGMVEELMDHRLRRHAQTLIWLAHRNGYIDVQGPRPLRPPATPASASELGLGAFQVGHGVPDAAPGGSGPFPSLLGRAAVLGDLPEILPAEAEETAEEDWQLGLTEISGSPPY